MSNKYSVQVWDYEDDQEAMNKLMNTIIDNKKIIVVLDDDDNDSFFVVGKAENIEADLKQAEIIKDMFNNPTENNDA